MSFIQHLVEKKSEKKLTIVHTVHANTKKQYLKFQLVNISA